MKPTTDEIAAGQKAYQRLKQFERNKWSPISFIVVLMASARTISDEYRKHGTQAALMVGACWILIIAAGVWCYHRQKLRAQNDLLMLQGMKATYGNGVYLEVQKEPRSLYYYLFQKRYPEDKRRTFSIP